MRIYTEENINYWKNKCKNKEVLHYGNTDPFLYIALKKYPIDNKDVLIIGSQEPCYEALALLYKAGSVTVVEYQELKSTYEKLRVLTVPQFENDDKLYDCVFSISSVEHSGLGRYGDPIDIDGDLKAMRVLHNKIKPNGICFLAVPIGKDYIEGILHRIYGEIRLPLLLEGWNILEKFDFDVNPFNVDQPLFVLQRK